jgi:hypothetical protein
VRGDLEEPRGAEVRDLQHVVLRHQDVRGAQIAVDDALRVRVVDGVADLAGEIQRPVQVQRTLRGDDVLERFPLHVLHHDEEDVLLLFCRRDGDDVGMTHAGEQPRLAQQLAEVEPLPMRNLDRDLLVDPRVLREVDGAEAAAAERRDDFVLP